MARITIPTKETVPAQTKATLERYERKRQLTGSFSRFLVGPFAKARGFYFSAQLIVT